MDELYTLYDNLEDYLKSRDRSCFFTGHRIIRASLRPTVAGLLKASVLYLITNVGVTDFHAGGALGFDTLAASAVIDVRRDRPAVRLILDLPYSAQAKGWKDTDTAIYRYILENADVVNYAKRDCDPLDRAQARKYLLLRNRLMCESSRYGIVYFTGARGGTAYTVNYANAHGCELTNIYDDMERTNQPS